MCFATIAASGVLAFFGAVVGHLLGRRTAREQERWRRREETMRMIRWAAELATARETDQVELGVTALTALVRSPLVDGEDVASLRSVLRAARRGYDGGEEVRDVQD